MAEQLLEAEAVEEDSVAGDSETAQVRRLPATRRGAEVDAVRGEVATAALAAAGGVLAGAATVVVVRAIGAVSRARGGRVITRGRRPAKVVASRSFLIDVHVLGDR